MRPKNSLSSESRVRCRLFIFTSVMGALLFVLIYGTKVLNPTYVDWIFTAGDRDAVQHYLGFCLYRTSPWKWPLGMISNASYPFDMSVIYTDSIPILAFIFKLFAPLLPVDFQYLGIYGLLSMAFMGGMGALLIFEGTGREDAAVLSSVFYILSWTVMHRMFYHTSLTAQWLILLALYMWMKLDTEKPLWKNCLIYGSFSALAMLIHPYLWAMCGGICILSFLEAALARKAFLPAAACTGSYLASGFLFMYIFGGFEGGVSASLGAGAYEANLNTLFNSMGKAIIGGRPVVLMQYEGFGYLGAGMLLMVPVVLFFMIKQRQFPPLTLRNAMLILTVVCFAIFAVIPEISFDDRILSNIPLPKILSTVVGIFRSNGRFIWVVCYIIITCLITALVNLTPGRKTLIILAVLIGIQAADMSPSFAVMNKTYSRGDYEYTGRPELCRLAEPYDVIMLDVNDLITEQDMSYYAYKTGKSTGRFYYARPIDEKVDRHIDELLRAMSDGVYDDRMIFIIAPDRVEKYRGLDLQFVEADGVVVAYHR